MDMSLSKLQDRYSGHTTEQLNQTEQDFTETVQFLKYIIFLFLFYFQALVCEIPFSLQPPNP